ncbi:MAG: hypothetical protein L6R39_003531 [Caloplaca ligustica]|nr:MAG: hypothetical protein L6R39_003531 [Caloplaca ligustica]
MLTSLGKRILYRIFFNGEDSTKTREYRQKRAWAAEKKQILKKKPAPLSSLRINISQTSFVPSATTVDRKPTLFSLPLEIRQKIYAFALGGNDLILRRKAKAIRSVTSPPLCSTFFGDERTYYDVIRPSTPPPKRCALLFTCRQVYVEAVNILYSSNNFGFVDPLTFVYLSDLRLLPQRVSAIKHVSFRWGYTPDPAFYIGSINEPYDWNTWQRFWDIMADHMRLRSLNVELFYWGGPEGLNIDSDWVKPMLRVKGIRQVELSVSWTTMAYSIEPQTELSSKLMKSMTQQEYPYQEQS